VAPAPSARVKGACQLHGPPTSYEDANVLLAKYKGFLNEFTLPRRIQLIFSPGVAGFDQARLSGPSFRRFRQTRQKPSTLPLGRQMAPDFIGRATNLHRSSANLPAKLNVDT
jgi:hypothetical protein